MTLKKTENDSLNFGNLVQLIENKINVGTNLNTKSSKFRYVKLIENNLLIVFVGKNNVVKITFESLFEIYRLTQKNIGIYNKSVCLEILRQQTLNKGCLVHVVGMIFVRIGVMRIVDGRNYNVILPKHL